MSIQYINVDRIEFMVTYRCNSNCKHCQLGVELRNTIPASISGELASRIVREVTDKYSPASIMTFGGEPLLYPDVVCDIHRTAKERGIKARTIITNIGYPREESEFLTVAKKLGDSGVTHIVASVDSFHEEYIPLETVMQNRGSAVQMFDSRDEAMSWLMD